MNRCTARVRRVAEGAAGTPNAAGVTPGRVRVLLLAALVALALPGWAHAAASPEDEDLLLQLVPSLSFDGAVCTGSGGGGRAIAQTATTFTTGGTISGGATCVDPDIGAFPIGVSGSYSASAAK